MIDAVPAQPLQPANLERARRQAEELEGVFLHTLVKQMFATVGSESDFGGDTWRSMQAEHLADAMAAAGGIGLADAIMRDLMGVQEAAPQPRFTPSQALPAYSGAAR